MSLDTIIQTLESVHAEALRVLGAGSQAGIGNERLARYAQQIRECGGGRHTDKVAERIDQLVNTVDGDEATRALFNLLTGLVAFRANRTVTVR